jgi:hypothetical protein
MHNKTAKKVFLWICIIIGIDLLAIGSAVLHANQNCGGKCEGEGTWYYLMVFIFLFFSFILSIILDFIVFFKSLLNYKNLDKIDKIIFALSIVFLILFAILISFYLFNIELKDLWKLILTFFVSL